MTFGQYQVNTAAPNCDLPECTELIDSSITPANQHQTLRSLGQPKGETSKATTSISQKMYHVESLNALFFVPEAFFPLESSFTIGGATRHISKVQIYHIETDELIFQTSIVENTWNGKWKNKAQYGLFKYVVSIHIDDNHIEQIIGIVETKKSTPTLE